MWQLHGYLLQLDPSRESDMSVHNVFWTFRTQLMLQKYWKFITCGSTRQISMKVYKFHVAKGTEATLGVTTKVVRKVKNVLAYKDIY
jgi:hypothetical protein